MSQTHEFKSEALRGLLDRGREEGREEGKAEAILQVLVARGIEVPEDLAGQIRSCRDMDTLNRWIGRVAVASSAEELLS